MSVSSSHHLADKRLFVEFFGDAGRHARSAVGVSSLSENITVEIEAIFEVS